MDCPSDSHDLVSISTTCYSLPIAIIHLTVSRILYRDLLPLLKVLYKKICSPRNHDPSGDVIPCAKRHHLSRAEMRTRPSVLSPRPDRIVSVRQLFFLETFPKILRGCKSK
ncbi:hypothetical protein TNCT_629531 [Trichonephila clavata]|uniref:Uncharacterized protein n=1 Tax=Trichonephila clavata TaxID=2740835 RepID=A0A8X6FAY1_TRICU|nr:hypothetical protein TNCT_629531 [Trichonephila clavata]